MENLDPIFLMMVISVVTVFILFVLYQLGMLLMESRETVSKVNMAADGMNEVVVKAKDAVEEGEKVLQNVLNPLRYLGAFMDVITNLVNGSSAQKVTTSETEPLKETE